ncbi:hypothetical protein CGCSCA1_v009401 [Colletotrichum siamense]|nr:hypothetical protein CGCSCA1_v009401 [Colletotrichum siamense]
MTPTDEEKNYSRLQLVFSDNNGPLDFDKSGQNDPSSQVHLEIVSIVDGGYGSKYVPGPQKVLCKVVQVASSPCAEDEKKPLVLQQLVLLKLYDPLFWHLKVPLIESYFKVTVRADKAQSVEVGAYSHLFRAGLTGFPHLAPQFHGCWTIAVSSTDPEYTGKVRHVVALAIEYVEGRRLSELFERSGPTRDRVVSSLSNPDEPPTYIATDEGTRLSIMAKLMDGLVSEEFADVNQGDFHPDNLIISLKDGQTTLKQPRIVQVSYRRAALTTSAKVPFKVYRYFATKPHPFIRFSMHRLLPFVGWLSPSWEGPKDDPNKPIFLDRWLALTFGPFTNNPTYTFRGNPPADVIVDDSGMVSPFSEYLEKKRLEEINPDEEAKPEEETAPAEEML